MNLNEAIAHEQSLPSGNYRVQFDMTEPAPIIDIKDKLRENGVEVLDVNQWQSQGLWHLGVSYKKPEPTTGISFLPMAVVPLVAFAIVGLLITVSIFKIETIANSLSKLLLIIGGFTVVALYINRKPATR